MAAAVTRRLLDWSAVGCGAATPSRDRLDLRLERAGACGGVVVVVVVVVVRPGPVSGSSRGGGELGMGGGERYVGRS